MACGGQILLVAGQDVGHRQHGHGVAHLALPELLVAAVAVVEDVGWRPAPDGLIGLLPDLLPHSGMRGLDRLAEFRDPLARQVDPGMDAPHFLQRRGNGLQPVRVPEAEPLDLLQANVRQVGVDLGRSVGPFLQRQPDALGPLRRAKLAAQPLPFAKRRCVVRVGVGLAKVAISVRRLELALQIGHRRAWPEAVHPHPGRQAIELPGRHRHGFRGGIVPALLDPAVNPQARQILAAGSHGGGALNGDCLGTRLPRSVARGEVPHHRLRRQGRAHSEAKLRDQTAGYIPGVHSSRPRLRSLMTTNCQGC